MHMSAYACGGQRSVSGVAPQALPTLFFKDSISHRPGIYHLGQVGWLQSPIDPSVSTSPLLGSQVYMAMSVFFFLGFGD